MRASLRFLMLLALVVWVGGIIFFAFVVAPALFSILPSRELAGRVVAQSLGALHWIGIAAGIVFLVASLVEARLATARNATARAALVAIMLILTLASEFGVSRRMQRLHEEIGAIDSVAATDARRAEFNRLHRWSTTLEGGVLLLGIASIFLMARE